MTDKVTLVDVANLENENTAIAQMAANNAAITTAMDNTLSLDGTLPNSMKASLDMDSHQIINLPQPLTLSSPLRLQDLNSFIGGGTISTIPSGGTTGQVLAKSSNANYSVAWINQPFINVTDYGAVGDSSTDCTAAFNAAIAALQANSYKGGTILVPAAQGFYVCSGTLNFNAKSGITLLGTAGVTGPAGSTSLLYTGAGARFIDCRDSGGIILRNLGITCNNAGFTGILIDAGGNTAAVASPAVFGSVSSNFQLDNCQVNRIGSLSITLLNMDQATDAKITNNLFNGGTPIIRGCTILAGNSTVCNFTNNIYSANVGPAIVGSGESWLFENETFEASSTGTANAFVSSGSIAGRGCTFLGCWFGDVTVSGGIWVTYTGQAFNFIGNRISGLTTSCEAISLYSCNGASITGNDFNTFSGAIDFATSGANSTGIVVSGNYFENVTAPFVSLSKVTGLIAEGNTPSASQYTSGQINVGQTSADAKPVTVSGDGTLAATGALTVTKTSGTAFTALATTVPATGVATFLATPSSANLATAVTDETGSGALVFGTSPTISNPAITGTISATGSIKSTGTGGIGYATGAGGAVTQITSRSTGVTLNTISGAITLLSAINAAVSAATAVTITVTNSTVAVTDTVSISQKSGTDKYMLFVTAVAAGSFAITFFTTGGTTTESPVFNFNVIKGVTS